MDSRRSIKTAKYFADLLSGREYGSEITRTEAVEAARNGVVIVFGYSDDNMEFRGAIDGEVSCYDGDAAFITRDGLLENKCDCADCPYHRANEERARKIVALWDRDGFAWTNRNLPLPSWILWVEEKEEL